MDSPLEGPPTGAASAQTIAQLASLQARAASQEQHARFLEVTLERRANGLASCHRSTAILSRRICEIEKRCADICLASEDAAPSRVPQTPATTPTTSSGAPSRIVLNPLAAGSAFLPSVTDKARGKLREDATSFAELCDAALGDFEGQWDAGADQARSWADTADQAGPSRRARASRHGKCIQGLGKEATELCLKVVKWAAQSPERIAEHILQLEVSGWQELTKRKSHDHDSQLELIVGVLRLVGGEAALLTFAERLFQLALERDQDTVQVEGLLLATLDALAATEAPSGGGRVGGTASPLILSPAAELHLLSYLRDCAREEGPIAGEGTTASSHGQSSRIPSRNITPRGPRQRRISTPSQSSLYALGTLGSSAAEYLTSGVSGVTNGLSSISGFFGGSREAQVGEAQTVSPPPRSAPLPAPALSRFVSSPAPSTSEISFPSVTTTPHNKAEAATGLDEVKEDLEAVLHAHPGQGAPVANDARSKLGQGQPSTPRRRTISEAQSAALRHGNIRTIRHEQGEEPVPSLASRAADGLLERLVPQGGPEDAPLGPSGLILTLSRSLLRHHFPPDQAPAQHRRIKLLIIVRWFGFAHLRDRICQPGRLLRVSNISRLGGSIVVSRDPRQLVTQPQPPKRPSLFEAVWTADQDTQLRLSNLHRAVYAKIVEAATSAGAPATSLSGSTGAQRVLSCFEGEASRKDASPPTASSAVSSLALTWQDGRSILEVLGPAFASGVDPAGSPQIKSGEQPQEPPSITADELGKALHDAEGLGRDEAPPTVLFTARSTAGRVIIKDSITTLREVLEASEEQATATSPVRATEVATSPTKAFFPRRDPTRGPPASSVFGTSESTTGGSGFADSSWGDEPPSPFHDTPRDSKPSYFDVGPRAARPATAGPTATPVDGLVISTMPRAIPSRRGSFRANNPPSAWRPGSSSAVTPTSAMPRAPPSAPRIPTLSESATQQVRRALSSLCKGQYLARITVPHAAMGPSKLFSLASLSARDAMRFDDAFLFEEVAQVIRAGARDTVAQGLREEGVVESQLMEPILASLARPLASAERQRAARVEAAHRALAEVDAQLASLRHVARDLFNACHEARCRVWYAAHIRGLPQVIEARRSSQALLHPPGGEHATSAVAAGEAASQWMVELGIYDFELDPTLKAYLRELEPIFSAIAGEASSFFASGLWSREAALARPLMSRGGDPDGEAALTQQTEGKVVLAFGRCSRSLLGASEKPPTIRSGLEDHFLQRVQLLSTGFFLSEALSIVRESSADKRLSRALKSRSSEQARAEPSTLARRLRDACAGELLQRFDLDPSPRSKLRSILVLERLVSAAMRSQHAQDQQPPARRASDHTVAGESSAEADGAKTPTVRAAAALSSSPVAIHRPLLQRQNSDRPGQPMVSPADMIAASPRRPLSVRSTAYMPRRVLSLYDDEDAMSVVSGHTYGATPHAIQKPLDSIQDLLASLEASETGQRAIGRWRLMAAQQQQHQQQQQYHSQQSSTAQAAPSQSQDLAGSMSEHSDVVGELRIDERPSAQRQGEHTSSHGGSTRAASASAGVSEMGSLRGRPPSVGASISVGEGRLGDERRPADLEEDDEGDGEGEGEGDGPESDGFEPTTDDMVGAFEELLAPPGKSDDEEGSVRERTTSSFGSIAPRELLLNLQIVAAFTPTTILDLKDEGKAFWDLCLAASMQRQLAGIDVADQRRVGG